MLHLRLAVLSAALALSGCGTQFASDREELSYLSDLSNPTPEQWKRKNELTIKVVKDMEAAAGPIWTPAREPDFVRPDVGNPEGPPRP